MREDKAFGMFPDSKSYKNQKTKQTYFCKQ